MRGNARIDAALAIVALAMVAVAFLYGVSQLTGLLSSL